MEEKETIEFYYGILCESLEEQALNQGFIIEEVDKFEKIRSAINLCMCHVATQSQVDFMFKKLQSHMIKKLVRIPKVED